ncbi:DUF4334 domain-containing protein [Mycobacteroides franklinii]|uniref:DUF4334 domain-containing protein n=1 Tax=Mycobacteroides franklinii TaxID=948102 RepID=A0A4R5PDB1_9MYCO|nr:DUF4334 domain-containing protein [Mycobacteroides franklinii]
MLLGRRRYGCWRPYRENGVHRRIVRCCLTAARYEPGPPVHNPPTNYQGTVSAAMIYARQPVVNHLRTRHPLHGRSRRSHRNRILHRA